MATPVLEKPAPSPVPSSHPGRFVAIRVNLLPDEVVQSRAADAMRRRVVLALVVVAALLVAWFGLSWWQTREAQSDLGDAQAQNAALQRQTQQFAPLVKAQSEVEAVQSRLQKLMVGDLAWKDMLTTLRAKAPSGLTLTQVSGTVTIGAAAAGTTSGSTSGQPGGYGALSPAGKDQVGTLTVTGTSRDKRSVASYADALGTVKGLAAPFITSVTTTGRTVTFGLTVLVTSDALGGRYAAEIAPKGGK